jgi:hypothetical protein
MITSCLRSEKDMGSEKQRAEMRDWGLENWSLRVILAFILSLWEPAERGLTLI